MPIYRLSPVEALEGDPSWEASMLKEACWIRADTPDSARHRVEMETAIFVAFSPNRPTPYPPWRSSRLVRCEEAEPPFEVPEGQIIRTDGAAF